MKKHLALALIFSLVLALTACGGAETAEITESDAFSERKTVSYDWFDITLKIPEAWQAHYTEEEIAAQDKPTQHYYIGENEALPFLMLQYNAGSYTGIATEKFITDYMDGVKSNAEDPTFSDAVITTVDGSDAFRFEFSGTLSGIPVKSSQVVFGREGGAVYVLSLMTEPGDTGSYQDDFESIVSSIKVKANQEDNSPASSSMFSNDKLFEEAADTLSTMVDEMEGIISSEIQANTLHTDLTATIVVDDSRYPIETFQWFVLDITDQLNTSLQSVEGEKRIRLDLSYPFSADPRVSWNHFANDEDIYHGSLSYDNGNRNSVYMDAHDIATNLESETFTNPPPVNLPSCSYEEYLQIKNGMTYDQVVEIIGSEGKETSTATLGGTTSSVYQWDGSAKYSNVTITFTNNAVVAKAQAGLG